MGTVIGWILTLSPIIFHILKKVLPKLFGSIGRLVGTLIGPTAGATGGVRGGVLGVILGYLVGLFGIFARIPRFFKWLFAADGLLAFVPKFLEFTLKFFKTPVLLGIALVTSSIFPTFIEKIFLVVGAAALHIFIWIFKLGRNVFLGALNEAATSGGSALDEFRDSVLGSFDSLPPCMVDIMGYLHLVEDLGLILTTAIVLALVSVFRIVYGGFFTKSGSPL